jgi:biopolymer transport protein ExbD
MSLRDQAGSSAASQQDESQIDLTPMLDVVFIMLIFFIVTSSFVKEPGVEIDKPGAATT